MIHFGADPRPAAANPKAVNLLITFKCAKLAKIKGFFSMTHAAVSATQFSKPEIGPIDMEHLLHYTMGDEALAREVLGLFCTQGRIYLEQLCATQDPQERKSAAHTLKGSARGVGAHHVANLSETLEELAAAPDEAAWTSALGSLKTVFDEAAAHVAEMD